MESSKEDLEKTMDTATTYTSTYQVITDDAKRLELIRLKILALLNKSPQIEGEQK